MKIDNSQVEFGGVTSDCASLKHFKGILNGRPVTLFLNRSTWKVKGKRGPILPGFLNGKPVLYKLTNGSGAGTFNCHYIYFDLGEDQYGIFTKDSWPKTIDITSSFVEA